MPLRIMLQRNWFAPNASRLLERENPHTVPDEWEKMLPSGTEFFKVEEEPEEPPEVAGESLSDHDNSRAEGDAIEKALANAEEEDPDEKERRENAEQFQRELKEAKEEEGEDEEGEDEEAEEEDTPAPKPALKKPRAKKPRTKKPRTKRKRIRRAPAGGTGRRRGAKE